MSRLFPSFPFSDEFVVEVDQDRFERELDQCFPAPSANPDRDLATSIPTIKELLRERVHLSAGEADVLIADALNIEVWSLWKRLQRVREHRI
jgi:hypothetical protein